MYYALEFVPHCYKAQKMCNRAVDTSSAMQFVPECYKAQEMIDKIVYVCLFYLILFLIAIRLKKYVIKLFPKILFLLKYSLVRYKTQKMCDKAVDAFLLTWKFVPNWFVTKKRLKNMKMIYSLMII